MSYCTNCGKQIPEGTKFCPNCGTPVTSHHNDASHKVVEEGTVHKCPHCGDVISSFTSVCPSCGYEFRDVNISSTVQSFVNVLSNTPTTEQKIVVIRNYPIPNTKEDIFEHIELSDVTLRRYIQELRAYLCNFNNGKTIKYDYFNRTYYLDNE